MPTQGFIYIIIIPAYFMFLFQLQIKYKINTDKFRAYSVVFFFD